MTNEYRTWTYQITRLLSYKAHMSCEWSNENPHRDDGGNESVDENPQRRELTHELDHATDADQAQEVDRRHLCMCTHECTRVQECTHVETASQLSEGQHLESNLFPQITFNKNCYDRGSDDEEINQIPRVSKKPPEPVPPAIEPNT